MFDQNNSDLKAIEDTQNFDEKINLNGALVTSGIGDAHVHVSDIGWAKEILDLHSSRSKGKKMSDNIAKENKVI